jgi:tetratricopeptide (TPR) repeat protein
VTRVQIRKEQFVLLGTLALVGLLGWRSYGRAPVKTSHQKPNTPAFVEHAAPDPARVRPAARASDPASGRELFAQPGETRPLPPLEFQPPPLAAFPGLRPPPVPGPAPAFFGKLLRASVAPLDAPDLFGAEASDSAAPATAGDSGATGIPLAQRIAGYKRSFDWLRTSDFKFGQIVNPDRFGLRRRPNEPILFVEYDPDKGVPRIPGLAPVPIEQKNVSEFDFADTVPNQVEIRRAAFGATLAAAEYDAALSFADWCIEKRHEAPRALAVAEEIFRRAAGVITTDPAPRIGLARVYEAGFQFEKAFQEYRALLDATHSPRVMARLAVLEARFRLFDQARARFEEAARGGRTDWQVQYGFGRFLAQRGEYAGALEHLQLANQFEPTGAEDKRERVGLRVALASALLATGDLAGGAEWIDKALQADAGDPQAQAARLSLLALGGGKPAANGELESASDGGSFEVLLARGIERLAARDAKNARLAEDLLEQAAAADPLRASLALRALSWLAETTGHPEQALHLVEAALENDPLDPWSLYQKGRLAAARDDLDGAEEAFARALEIELDFADALVAMGELQHRRGEFLAAERYLERALQLEGKRADVLALRGLNQIRMGSLRDAEDTLRAALAVDPDQPGARAGLAWCQYRRNDPTQAISSLRDLDDSRRALPPTDPMRVWAQGQIERIQDHVQKVAWTDRFERSNLMNQWEPDEKNGPQLSIHDGHVTLAGVFKSSGRARLWREIGAAIFVSVEMKITVHADTTAQVGLSVSRETQRAGETQVDAEAVVLRHFEPGRNTVQTRLVTRGHEDDPYVDAAGLEWKFEQPMTVRIERSGDSSDTRIRILVDGFPVVEGKPMPTLGRGTNPLRLSLFAEGATGKKVNVDLDDVEVVYRETK